IQQVRDEERARASQPTNQPTNQRCGQLLIPHSPKNFQPRMNMGGHGFLRTRVLSRSALRTLHSALFHGSFTSAVRMGSNGEATGFGVVPSGSADGSSLSGRMFR